MEEDLRQIKSNCIKVVLFGPESTGKSTLCEALAEKFNTHWVPEFMRSYLQKKWDKDKEKITKADLLPIAHGQIASENEMAEKTDTYLFCDTNLREIKVYSEYYYEGFCPAEIINAVDNHHYHHYFLTDVDLPWRADDLRDHPHDRQNMFRIFEVELINNQLPFTILSGTLEERIEKATQVLETLKL